MMSSTREMFQKSRLSGFIIHEKEVFVYATTRNKQANLNPEDLIVLSPLHPVTRKIVFSYHNISHRGVHHTVARSRIFYWIPQATKLTKAIKNSCFTCRKKDA